MSSPLVAEAVGSIARLTAQRLISTSYTEIHRSEEFGLGALKIVLAGNRIGASSGNCAFYLPAAGAGLQVSLTALCRIN